MKRTTTLLAAGLVGLSAAPAAWAEFTLYGSVRSGIVHLAKEGTTDTSWDLGSVDAEDLGSKDKLWSRIGVRASYELDSGMTSGLHIEKRLDDFRTRHQNVWLQGAFGRMTFGQQGSTFHSATTWDGTNLYGGNTEGHGSSRGTGLKLAFGGDDLPVSVEVMARDDGKSGGGAGDSLLDRLEFKAQADVGSWVTVSGGYLRLRQDNESICKDKMDDDLVKCNMENPGVRSLGDMSAWGGTLGGAAGGLSWKMGYATSSDYQDQRHGGGTTEIDWKRYGAFLGYSMGPGTVYAYYEDFNLDKRLNAEGNAVVSNPGDNDAFLFGYSHSLGTNTSIILEHLRPDTGQKKTALAVKIDF